MIDDFPGIINIFFKTLRFTSLSDKMKSSLYSTYILINDTDIFE